MLEDVKKRLESLGYTYLETDSWVLGFIIDKIETKIKSDCGVWDSGTSSIIIPEGLIKTAIDMICGEFLIGKKNTGQLVEFNFDAAVKSIQEGDTNVTFAFGSGSKTTEERFDELISYLLHGEADFSSYRRMRW